MGADGSEIQQREKLPIAGFSSGRMDPRCPAS
jgi:hypothetical protein